MNFDYRKHYEKLIHDLTVLINESVSDGEEIFEVDNFWENDEVVFRKNSEGVKA